MIDRYLYGDILAKVNKKCKKKYKKGIVDKSWQKEAEKIMKLPISEIYKFLEDK